MRSDQRVNGLLTLEEMAWHETPRMQDDDLRYNLGLPVIEHDYFLSVVSEIARLHLAWRMHGTFRGLVVVGQSGVGKTTLEQWYSAHQASRPLVDRQSVPVLQVSTPERPSGSRIATRLINALGVGGHKADPENSLDRLHDQLKRTEVELIFLSEFQHIYDHRPGDTQRVTDWLKDFYDRFKRPIVITCQPRGALTVQANAQLRRRFSRIIWLKEFDISSEKSFSGLRSVLKTIHEAVKIDAISFHEKIMAQRFYYASSGCIDYIVQVIQSALDICRTKRCALSQETLGKAFQDLWPTVPPEANPFTCEFSNLRLLRQQNEPFEKWDMAWPAEREK